MTMAYVDGRVRRLDEARVPLADRGYLFGEGIFETLRARASVFRLEEHLDRLANGASVLGFPDPRRDAGEAIAALHAAGIEAGLEDMAIRIQVTAQATDRFELPGPPGVTGTVRPRIAPFDLGPEREVRLLTAPDRIQLQGLLTGVKATSYSMRAAARRWAQGGGGHDALFLNDAGRVAEATTANVVAMVDGVVHAPGRSEGALAGVTAKWLTERLAGAGSKVVGRLALDQIREADWVAVTSTLAGVVGVASIDGVDCRRDPRSIESLQRAYDVALGPAP